jgi:hypothetical protein
MHSIKYSIPVYGGDGYYTSELLGSLVGGWRAEIREQLKRAA